MKNILQQLLWVSLLSVIGLAHAYGQNSPNCETFSDDDFLIGRAFFTYGSASNAFSTTSRADITVGQPVVDNYFGQLNKGSYGFWSRFLMPPAAPAVMASEGDLEDRVQIDWAPDPLSPAPSSYKIYRNGSLLATVDGETFSFLDFNVLAGKFYTYEVSGVNTFGEGKRGSSLGFLNPNGVVTGKVETFSGNAVPGAIVTLTPTLGHSIAFNGADDMAFAEYNPAFPRHEFTVSAWVKLGDGNDNAGIIDFGSTIGKNWWLHTLPASSGKGIRFGIGRDAGDVTELDYAFLSENEDEWHYVAASYNGASLLLYVDGELIETAVGTVQADSIPLFLGKKADDTGFFNGRIDEVRFFDRQLAQTEIQMFMNRTVQGNAPGLTGYWKFDEGVGAKAFDQSALKARFYFCGAEWSDDRPEVVNSGITDESGFYEIAGINYGSGQTFTARPSKSFYLNQSLEFNGVNGSYADLTDFDIKDTSAITTTVKAFDFSGNQSVLSKADAGGNNLFALCLNAGQLELVLNETSHAFGPLEMGFHHIAVNLIQDGSTLTTEVYKNGNLMGTHSFSGVATDWAGLPWKIGAKADGASSHRSFFTGLIDEVVFFDSTLTLPQIQEYANIGTDVNNLFLKSNFSLNEGEGLQLEDTGPAFTGEGTIFGATWSTVSSIMETIAHEFTPASRLVTLDPSNTSADGIDFIDQSTIPVSGFVRHEGTTCFPEGIEILVNGQSNVPKIRTDENGKFVADFEPGADVVLTPVFEDHTFFPAFWELENLNVPVSGILFQDQTKRTVTGQLAGGKCRRSIIPDGSIVRVKLSSLDGCYEATQRLENPNGKFTFSNVPPDSLTIAVIEHSNPVIYDYFQNQGGRTLDLRMKSDTVDFIYLAPPQVEMTQLDTNSCGDPMLNQLQTAETTIRVFEAYDGGVCYLDTALITINNGIANLTQFDTLMTEGSLVHQFQADAPNIVPPFLKTLQVTAEAHDEQDTKTQSAVVLGRRPRETTFTSTAPELPTIILRDPPGDGSHSFLEVGEKTCQNWKFKASSAMNTDFDLKLHLGPDIMTNQGSPFFSTVLKVDVTADLGFQLDASTTSYTSNAMETCLTVTKKFATSSSEAFVGSDMGGDLYVGGAMNFIYGITDELIYDTTSCSYLLDKGLYIFPDGFATTFVYSENQISNVVIPSLLTIGDTTSAERWQEIIDLNTQLKEEAIFDRNISFDAGVTYNESQTTQVTKAITHSWTQSFSTGFSTAFGVNVNGLGLTTGLAMSWSTETSTTATNTTSTQRKTGFVLSDNDPLDNYTVNIKTDPAYGTPVFDVVSGQSSCPWEPNTQPRDGVDLSVNQNVAVNVPMNEPAVFTLSLGNNSPTEETRTYNLSTDQTSNPDGAVIRFNGESSIDVTLAPFESRDVTMTVERGPNAFSYQDLSVVFRSACDGNFSETEEFDVEFLEPCSMVGLGFPLPGWVVTPSNGNILNITVNDYDTDDPDLELIRVQYRRSQGDGAWINIAELQKNELGGVFTIVPWNTQGLQDGLYEIRSVSQCFGAQNPGLSDIIKGKIERTPPRLFGLPQPADGVLSPGDEISITFNEPIRCDLLIQADVFNNNNIGLYNTATGELIDAVISCSEDKIIVVPNVPNQFIENQILRVVVEDVEDQVGNMLEDPVSWEFFVNRSTLYWEVNQIKEVIPEGDVLEITRNIRNQGGAAANFTLTDLPAWVEASPLSGTVAPGSFETVTFTFSSDLVPGSYEQILPMMTAEGDEPLDINVQVVCPQPAWEVNPMEWAYSMTMTLQLDIEGEISTDKLDLIGAFVGGELRGVAAVEYVPEVEEHLAFLTVYSNNLVGETVTFQIWDAMECLLYGTTNESFDFVADDLIGSPIVPQVIHTNNLLLRKIPIFPGWNWISYNLELPDPSINAALSSLTRPEDATIKGQTSFSQYFNGGSVWAGSLTALSHLTMYQYNGTAFDSLEILGNPIDPATPMSLSAGWNWIGYLPQAGMPVNQALASLSPLNGDIIKSQAGFAQYVAGVGWVGNLDFLSSPNGYLINLSEAGTLTYPESFNGPNEEAFRSNEGIEGRSTGQWEVDPHQYEHSMNLIALVTDAETGNLLHEGDEVGAFINGEVRGSAQPIYVEAVDAYLLFMTVYGNAEGGTVTFKYYDGTDGEIKAVEESFVFIANDILGTVNLPEPLTLQSVTATESLSGSAPRFELFPNPATERVYLSFEAPAAADIIVVVTDATGREVARIETEAAAGGNLLEWRPNNLAAGLYFVTLHSNGQVQSAKLNLRP
ncbi:MAG: LamG-like jellyroll fold domain-containing protein [Phaeodactylibacter xiamenensis]|uniref:LamG-like jellyroll fold domain-containing protein n=1 Tax=Phaeodactylibacter xiamenensis TaxID=1524460 RepID=UPI00391C1E33